MLASATDLTYFIEVANSLNLSRASERLGISQPSLSLAIKRLEAAIGADILLRHKHGVTLTQAGKQLLVHAKQLLLYWEKTKAKALASQAEIQGSFTIGCHSTMAMHIIAHVLPDLLTKYPKLEIKLKHDLSRKISEEVVNLSIDIGIAANPLKHPDLVIRRLCQDEVTLWKGPGNRSIQTINSNAAVLICDPDLTQTQSLLKQLKKAGITFDRMLTTPSLEVVATLTAKGNGIGILPARVAKNLYADKLKRIPHMPSYQDELCLIYRDENRDIVAVQTILDAIKNHSCLATYK